jgi:uncharacterized protein involved in outer membrane biogenesis
MQLSLDARKCRILVVRTLLGVGALLALLIVAVLIFAGHLRGPVVRYAAAQTGRQIKVEGRFDAYLFCLHPRFVAEHVVIGNPPWTAPGVMAEIGRLSVTYDLPFFGQSFGVRRLSLEQAKLHLARDETGRANWQTQPPGSGYSNGPPLIRGLSMPEASVQFDDQRRHLQFDGIISAQDAPSQGATAPLRIRGAGQLNGRAANFTLDGDPLATVSRDRPYGFEFTESSSGTRLTGKGSVPHPFDFHELEATFDSAGEDMKDLYFLTGVSLPDTGKYQLSGKFTRRPHHLDFTGLEAKTGRSDMSGSVLIDTKRDAPSHIEADLRSQLLRLSDLGQRAAGREPKPVDGRRLVLPDTPFHLQGTRRSDAVIDFRAQQFEAGRVALRTLATRVKIDQGSIVVAPLSATLREGKVAGEIKIDATRDVPAVAVDFRLTNMKLGKFGRKDDADPAPPPLDGPLQARITLKGRGNSIHELASNASGTVTAVLPHGALRSSLAELAGFDLRGLGLMATGNKQDTGIRCGVASFEARDGTLTAQRLLVDTEPVLITGEGTVNLDSEALDMQFHGRPKHPRLRVRAPLLVRGTFGHPSFSIDGKKPAAQAGEAIALGMLLTPVAAMLAFVDPGLAKDTDCAALLAEAGSGSK